MFYHIITYGCLMNHSDSERIASVLESMGYKPAPKEDQADLIVINVCSVRQRAIDRVFGQCQKLVKLKTLNHKLKTILTGCVLEEDKKKLKDKVDMILNIKDLSQLSDLIKKSFFVPMLRSIGTKLNYLKIKPHHHDKFSAYVPIMTGCNNFCSYCVVPYVRGREYSRPAKRIVEEVKNLVERGYKEITLIGQNVNSYKSQTPMPNVQSNPKSSILRSSATAEDGQTPKSKISFPRLLRIVNDIEGNFWLRFVTSHPKDMSDELIDAIANCDKICEYIHLPVQSGDDEILKMMNRGYTAKQYLALIEKIRAKIPNAAISTDAIVGFPGETKKQFENTVRLFKRVGFDMAYIAQYSPRAGTTAAKLKDNVPPQEKKRREEILNEILKKTALKNNKKYIGKILEVLVIKDSPLRQRLSLTSKTRTFKNVKFESDKSLVGNFVKVKIIGATPWGLKGKLT